MHQKHSYIAIANDGGEVEDSILKIKMPLAKILGKKPKPNCKVNRNYPKPG